MAELTLLHKSVLTQYNKIVRTKNITNLKEIKGLLNTIYGEACNQIAEIEINKYDDNDIPFANYMGELLKRDKDIHYTVTLHFPEIEIRNKLDKKHIIRDLFVRFHLDGNLKMKSGLSGMRTTYTPEEYSGDYCHSHLSGRCTDFSNFCLGTGPINMIMGKLFTGYKSIDFQMFLHTINQYVRYESLDGVPYRYIKNLGISNNAIRAIVLNKEDRKKLLALIFNAVLVNQKKLGYTVSTTGVKVVPTDEFEAVIAEVINAAYSHPEFVGLFSQYERADVLPYKSDTGQYVKNTIRNNNIRTNNNTLINFKNTDLPLKIYYDTINIVSNKQYVNPGIIGNIYDQLSTILTKAAITNQAAT